MHRRALFALAGVAALGSGARPAAAQPRARHTVYPAQTEWSPEPPQAPAVRGFVDSGGARLAYWDTGGSGQAIVLLHPATGSADIWGYQQPVFARAGYRVIGYSRRGHGATVDGPPDDKTTGSADLSALVTKLGLGRIHLVASAGGGFTAPDFALSYPQQLRSMVLACSQGGVSDPEYRAVSVRITPKGFQEMPASFRELGPSYRAANPEGVARWEALEHNARPGRAAVLGPMQGGQNVLTWENISRIRTPSLVMTGGADLFLPPTRLAEWRRRLPDCHTAVIAESGHSAYWEQPDAFNKAVLDFVRQHS